VLLSHLHHDHLHLPSLSRHVEVRVVELGGSTPVLPGDLT